MLALDKQNSKRFDEMLARKTNTKNLTLCNDVILGIDQSRFAITNLKHIDNNTVREATLLYRKI